MTTSNVPPLDMDLAAVDTSLPLLAENTYELKIEKAEIVPTASGGRMIKLDHVTTAPSSSMKGEPLGPGIHVFNNVNVIPTGKATWETIQRGVAELVQSAKLTGVTLGTVDQWVKQLEGRIVRARVTYVAESTNPQTGKSFRAKNEIKAYLK